MPVSEDAVGSVLEETVALLQDQRTVVRAQLWLVRQLQRESNVLVDGGDDWRRGPCRRRRGRGGGRRGEGVFALQSEHPVERQGDAAREDGRGQRDDRHAHGQRVQRGLVAAATHCRTQ